MNIDTSKAEKLPGVRGIVLGSDLPFLHGEALRDRPLLARDRVRYLGEPVAAVAAVSEAVAEEAVELVFRCPTCNKPMMHFENKKIIEVLNVKIGELRKELSE